MVAGEHSNAPALIRLPSAEKEALPRRLPQLNKPGALNLNSPADGRIWLRASDAEFDLIILDAYRQPSIPSHLATVEFFEDVRAHLGPGGLAVLNVFAPTEHSRIVGGIGATWSRVFPRTEIFEGPAFDGLASHLLFGGPAVPVDTERYTIAQIPAPLRTGWAHLQRTREFRADPTVAVWSDDRAPVELLTDRAYRSLRPPNPDS